MESVFPDGQVPIKPIQMYGVYLKVVIKARELLHQIVEGFKEIHDDERPNDFVSKGKKKELGEKLSLEIVASKVSDASCL